MTLEQKLDELAARQISCSTPGFAFLAARDGKVFLKKAYGMADIRAKDPIRPDDNFMIASNTKQFTCFAILMLREKGLLSLDESIERFFPQLPDYTKRISIRNLMTHTSGLKEYFEFADESAKDAFSDYLAEDLIAAIPSFGGLDFEPDTDFSYCNTAYVLLGDIIRQLSGMPFGRFIEEKILRPLGMTRSFAPDGPVRDRWQVEGYYRAEDGSICLAPYNMFEVGYADGNISSNTEDMLKWVSYLHSDSDELLPKAVRREMMQSHILADGRPTNYGFGLITDRNDFLETPNVEGVREIWHTGGTEGFISRCSYYPETKTAIIMLTNYRGMKRDEIFIPIAEEILKEGTGRE